MLSPASKMKLSTTSVPKLAGQMISRNGILAETDLQDGFNVFTRVYFGDKVIKVQIQI